MKRNKKRIWKSERDWGWPEYPVCQCTRPTFKKWRLFKMASFSLIYLFFFSFLFFSFFVVVVAVVVVSTSSSSWSSFSSSATPLKWRRQRRLMSSDHICHVDTFPFIRFDSSFYHLIYIYIYIYILVLYCFILTNSVFFSFLNIIVISFGMVVRCGFSARHTSFVLMAATSFHRPAPAATFSPQWHSSCNFSGNGKSQSGAAAG